MLDGDALAAGKAYLRARRRGAFARPPAARLGADDKGSEIYTLRVRDLATGAGPAPMSIPRHLGELVVWTADSSAFYYVRLDDNHRPSRVFATGSARRPTDDVLVYEEADAGLFVIARPDAVGPLR